MKERTNKTIINIRDYKKTGNRKDTKNRSEQKDMKKIEIKQYLR